MKRSNEAKRKERKGKERMADSLKNKASTLVDNDDDDDAEPIPVETDPTGRYHRYDDVLGRGAYKTVYKGFDGEEGIEVAWNQIRVNKIVKTDEEKERLFQEVDLLKELSHKSIIKFYASWIDEKTQDVNFITEMFTSGTLRQYRKRHKKLDEKVIKSWTRQILRGLLYLHGHDPPIIHRDLKADNIFVNGNQGELKIGDLGLATLLRTTQGATSVLGTPEFMAPELYEEDYDERVDIYALGMCLLELVTFQYPYQECENAAQIYKKVSSGIRPAGLEKVDKEGLRNFIETCISDIENRPSARELLESEYLYKEPQKDKKKEEKKEILKEKKMTDMKEKKMEDSSEHKLLQSPSENSHSDSEGKSSRGSTKDNVQEGAGLGGLSSQGSFGNSDQQWSRGNNNATGNEEAPGVSYLSPEFRVRGKVSEDNSNVLYMKLKINAEGGVCNTVSFLFDCRSDSARSVAAEMVQEFDWSHDDELVIAATIQEEVRKLTSSASDQSAAAAANHSNPMKNTNSFENVHDLSSEIHSIEHEIEELCKQQREEENEMKKRHKEALQKVKTKLEETKLRSGGLSPKHHPANGIKMNGSKPMTEQKIMQMQAKALEGLGGLGSMNGDTKNGSSKPKVLKTT